MTEEEIHALQENLETLTASLECLRLVSLMHQAMGTHQEVYPTAERVLTSAITSCTNMREQIRQERGKLPYKLP